MRTLFVKQEMWLTTPDARSCLTPGSSLDDKRATVADRCKIMASRPRGRPPIRHRWSEGVYIQEDSGVPYAAGRNEHEETLREMR